MKVKLTKGNIWYLIPTMGKWTFKEVYYDKDTPDYILDYLKKQECIDLIEGDIVKNEDDIVLDYSENLRDRWPTKEEVENGEDGRFLVDDKTFLTYLHSRSDFDFITLDKSSASVKKVNEVPFGVVYRKWESDVPLVTDSHYYDMVQFIPKSNVYTDCYRRRKLSEIFKSKLDYSEYKDNTYMNCHILYVSGPVQYDFLNHFIKYDILVYDRTDNWTAKDEAERHTLENATVVINSSEWLYNDSKSKRGQNTYYIPNGCTRFDPIETEKIDRYVYLGNTSFDKVDLDEMNKYPTDVYGKYVDVAILKDYPNLEYKGFLEEKDFPTVLPKYKGGLIPFKKDDWTAGMLPIKYFVYKCAGLPVISTYDYGDIEVKDWSEIAEEILNTIGQNSSQNFELVRRPEDRLSIWWSISKQCNFRCPYCCQTDKTVKKVDVDKVSKHLRSLMEKSKFNKFQISLLGGEPALFDLETIITNLSSDKWDLRVDILTNFSLKDADYYKHLQSLHPNTEVHICASCHISQVKDMDKWMQKVRDVGNNIHAKFVIGDSNFEETKKVIDKYHDVPMTFEGMRDANHYPLFNDEIAKFIRNNNDTQTDLIVKVHALNIPKVECWRRLALRGDEVHSGCKMKETITSVYDLDSLDWIYRECNLSRVCNLCMVGKMKSK